jgi:hypothetical protein
LAVEPPADVAGQLDRVSAFDPFGFERLEERQGQGGEEHVLAAAERGLAREIRHLALEPLEAVIHDPHDL